MPKIEIKHRQTGAVLYTYQATAERQASGLALRDALEAAAKARADLSGANLTGANLTGANLARSNLSGSDLSRANLSRANLSGANLTGANLTGANLARSNLSRADLAGAEVRGQRLIGSRPYLQIGPIGSRCATLNLWMTESGPHIQTGCFFGSRTAFEAAVAEEHGDNVHGREYSAALALINAHVDAWTPAVETAAEVAA